MTPKFLLFIVVLLAGLSIGTTSRLRAQEPLDGRGHAFHDDLLEHLVGDWKLTRKIKDRSAQNTVKAEWVLDHQFLLLHMKDVGTPAEYEAFIYVGYDNTSERYVAHWIDVYGGRFSETLGYGKRAGNSIKFVFEYPDGPFNNTFTWDSTKNGWNFLMENRSQNGEWHIFGEDTLGRL